MTRPPVPRPSSRPSSPPLAPRMPAFPLGAVAPVIRERLETLDLDDGDIVESKPQLAPVRRSSAPPPPPLRQSSAPPPPPAAVASPFVLTPPPAPFVLTPPPSSASLPPDSAVRLTEHAPAPPALRPSAPDPTDLLFDGLYELNFMQGLDEAAQLCASRLGAALGARAVVVHAHDLTRRELHAIATHGAERCGVLGSTESSDDDLVASAAICNEAPVTMRFDGELPRIAPRRLAAVGAPRVVVAVPAMAWGRCLAVIEVIDADERFALRVADAASYVAERFAEFLSHRVAA